MGGSTEFVHYPLWIAHYTTRFTPTLPAGWERHTMWQYTSAVSVSGISADVDRNRFNGARADLAALSNGSPTTVTLTPPHRVGADGTVELAGRLTTRAGNALAGRTVRVYGRLPGQTFWTLMRKQTTNSHGGHRVLVAPDASAEYVARYAGDILHRRAAAGTTVAVTRRESRLAFRAGAARVTTAGPPPCRGVLSAVGADPVAGARVQIQQRPGGADAWTRLAVATTVADGAFAVRVTPEKRTAYRAWYSGDTTHRRAAGGRVVVRVVQRVSARLSDSRPRVKTVVYLTGRVGPVRQSSRVYRQRYHGGRWYRVATTTVSSTGRYRFAFRPGRRAVYRYRVVARYGDGLTTGASPARVLRPR